MKKYKSFNMLLPYITDFYGPTLTEKKLYDPNYSFSTITNIQFKYGGCYYKLPFTMDWDWIREDDGFHVNFYHLSSGPNSSFIDTLIEEELKGRLFKFGKISKNIHIYFNNRNLYE